MCQNLRTDSRATLADRARYGACRKSTAWRGSSGRACRDPDSEALRTADDAITPGEASDCTGARSRIEAKLKRMATRFCEGSQPDFADAPLTELLAFCVAFETTPKPTR